MLFALLLAAIVNLRQFLCIGADVIQAHFFDPRFLIRAFSRAFARIGDLSLRYGLGVANVFHAGDGNLHPLILYDANEEGQLERAEAFGNDILRLCVEMGGVLTGEHGVGTGKIAYLRQEHGDAVELMAIIKNAIDPGGIMNPGKIVDPPPWTSQLRFGPDYAVKEPVPFLDFSREGGFARAVEHVGGRRDP